LHACLIALAAVAPAHAQLIAPAIVHVRVTDTLGVPIADANLASLRARQQEAVLIGRTDASGTHTFTLQPESASYRIAVRKLGYVETTRRLLVAPGDTVSIELPLATLAPATQLPAIVTTEKYRLDTDPGLWEGFDRRCQSKLVFCFGDAYLGDRPSYSLVDVLSHADGIISHSGPPTMHASTLGKCQPTYYVDGFKWGLGWNALVSSYGLLQLKGMEVYRSEQPRPLRFEGDPVCGAIVFWTK
jgi:hypothetical protein